MDKWSQYWDNICEIYFLTKHYLLLAEELSEDFDTVFQPVKEHRDAFDHIARVYGYKLSKDDIKDIESYRSANMRKAVGHAYRAFFDTADFLSYICRRKIRELLQGKSREEIIQKYPQYEDSRQLLNELPEKIAKIRENKDVSDDECELVKEVEEYRVILDDLLKIYKTINRIFG